MRDHRSLADADDDGRTASQDQARRPRERPPERAPGNLPRNRDGAISRGKVTDDELDAAGNMTSSQLAEHTALRNGAVTGKPARPAQRLHDADPDDPWTEPGLRIPQSAQPANGVIDATSSLIGRPITSTNDLTAAEGKTVMSVLSRCRDRGQLIERLAAAQETP